MLKKLSHNGNVQAIGKLFDFEHSTQFKYMFTSYYLQLFKKNGINKNINTLNIMNQGPIASRAVARALQLVHLIIITLAILLLSVVLIRIIILFSRENIIVSERRAIILPGSDLAAQQRAIVLHSICSSVRLSR
jgi:hypothetical protein